MRHLSLSPFLFACLSALVFSQVPNSSSPVLASCEPAPPKGTDFKTSHIKRIRRAATHFCDTYTHNKNISVTPESLPIEGTIKGSAEYTGTTKEYDVYEFNISAREECLANLREPYKEDTHKKKKKKKQCKDVFLDAWQKCKDKTYGGNIGGNNQGRGGSMDVGCLTYSVRTKY